MKLTYQKYDLHLRHPFRIAVYTRTYTPIVLIQIAHEGIIGYGECSMPQYLGETQETAAAFFEWVEAEKILTQVPPNTIDIHAIMAEIERLKSGNTAAKAAIDIALHDLKGKIEKRSVWQILGSQPNPMPKTSYTIGIDTPSVLRQKVAESAGFDILKIKLGSDDDKQIIRTIREVSDKPLYVDANQGWADVSFALDMIHWLREQGVLLIEQPMLKTDLEGNARVTEGSPLPILADESFQRLTDFERISGAFHGVNIKLMKATGLCEAQKMVAEARRRQMRIMVGCMSETSCGIMAAAALAPQCDYADLDTTWLVSNNPFESPILRGGKIALTEAFGLGLVGGY
jgi:L-alanine-DL-glutamate epimerase-like enolase superfamily enzyme